MRSNVRGARRLIPVLLLGLLMGCASTQKRFETATGYEAAGQYLQAANAYIQVLEREPTWPNARVRLAQSGARAIEQLMTQVEAAAGAGDPARGVALLDTAADLHRRSGSVGVPLFLPDDFTATRDRLIVAAVDRHVATAKAAEHMQDWPRAVTEIEAAQAYPMVNSRYRELDDWRGRLHIAWAEAELGIGHFRSAHAHVHVALEILHPDASERAVAMRMAERALRQGERRIVLVPFSETETVRHRAPSGFTQELNDVLLYEQWREPPLFLAVVDPAAVHVEMRKLGLTRDSVTDREAFTIAHHVNGDFIVVGDVGAFTRSDVVKRTRTVPARTRGRDGVDTTYVEEQLEITFTATVSYTTLDATSRTTVRRRNVTKRVSDVIPRGRFDGDPRDLDLSRREKTLFDRAALDDAEWTLARTLARALAGDISSPVQVALLDRIP